MIRETDPASAYLVRRTRTFATSWASWCAKGVLKNRVCCHPELSVIPHIRQVNSGINSETIQNSLMARLR